MEDNLPTVKESTEIAIPEGVVPESNFITSSTTPEENKELDVFLVNMQMAFLLASWRGVKSINQVCNLSRATFSAIEKRRHILGHPYGNKDYTTKGSGGVYEID